MPPDDDVIPPYPTGKPLQELTISGCLLPMEDDQPIQLEMPGSPYVYVAIFSTKEKLDKAMLDFATAYADVNRIVQITDAAEFRESLGSVVLIVDPWINHETGKTRFMQVKSNA